MAAGRSQILPTNNVWGVDAAVRHVLWYGVTCHPADTADKQRLRCGCSSCSSVCTAAASTYPYQYTAALAVTYYYLHSPSTASRACYRRSTCIHWYGHVEACGRTLTVTLFAWHSSCHTSQPVLFRATDDNPQLALFRASNVWKNATNLQSDDKVLQFKSQSGDIFRWGGQVDYSLFSSEIT